MKILFVHEKCGWFGGVEQTVADTAHALRQRGHECHLAFGTDEARGAAEYAALFDGSHPCPELEPARTRTAGTTTGGGKASFAAILSRVDPGVLYIHKAPDLSFLEPFFGRVRTVRMIHDHDLCCPRRHGYTLLAGRICRRPAGGRCLLCAAFLARDHAAPAGIRLRRPGPFFAELERNKKLDLVIAGSRFMKEELARNGFAEKKIRLLPPAVRMDSAAFTPLPEGKRILYVGQLVRGKGVHLLLRALARLRGDFEAVIAGEGNHRPRLEALCRRLGLSERVRFAGWVDHREIEELYAAARVVAVPSFWAEPFGMVGLEAMNHGRPVVAFAAGGIPDWLEHGMTGLLAPERDAAALAEALQRLLDDREWAALLGETGRKRSRERFAFEDLTDRLESFLLGLSGAAGRGATGKEESPGFRRFAGREKRRSGQSPAAPDPGAAAGTVPAGRRTP